MMSNSSESQAAEETKRSSPPEAPAEVTPDEQQPPQDKTQGSAAMTNGGGDEPKQAAAAATTCNNLENIKVAVRLRPFTEKERQRHSRRIVDIEQNTVALYCHKYDGEVLAKKFTFDYSYWSHDGFKRNQEGVNVPDPEHPNSSKYVGQERVFEDLGRFLLENAIQGYNSALLAYGQTGSGKSYTVSGYGQNEGILPRFARELFAELDARFEKTKPSQDDNQTGAEAGQEPKAAPSNKRQASKNRYEVYFSMIEIYNEVVRDLLAKQNHGLGPNQPGGGAAPRRGLRVREHPKRGFFVEALSSFPCANKEEIERLIEEGQLNKSIAATSMNETSSRGHTIYEFHIKQHRSKPICGPVEPPSLGSQEEGRAPAAQRGAAPSADENSVQTLTSSVVQLVDLAGSERMAVHMTAPGMGVPDVYAGGGGSARSNSPFPPGGGSNRQAADQAAAPRAPGRRPRGQPSSASPSGATTATTATAAAATAGSNQLAGQKTASLRRQAQRQPPGAPTAQPLSHLNLMTGNNQQRFKESVSINQSLSALGNCIQVLSQYSQQQQQQQMTMMTSDNSSLASGASGGTANTATRQQPKIPYRDSVLTKLLNRCCLSGNSKVVLIATLSPAEANYDDSLSTLRFADRAKQIRTHALINRSSRNEALSSSSSSVNALQRENERLKQILDGRVTRSDDSSQTSNFDDTENMLDNFNGPQAGEPAASTKNGSSTSATAAAAASAAAGGTIKRGRAVAKRGEVGAAQKQVSRARSQLRTSTTRRHHDAPSRVGAGRGESNRKAHATTGNELAATSQRATAGLRVSASNPALAGGHVGVAPVDSEQMKQLVSSGRRKMRQNTHNLGSLSRDDENDNDNDNEEEEEEDEAEGQATGALELDDREGETGNELRKSRSLGQGLASRIGGHESTTGNEDELRAEEIELASGLLDEIDLNELASIIDDENLISPDSDDSATNGDRATPTKRAHHLSSPLEEGHLSHEEKLSILNKILNNNSGLANRIIKQKLEENLAAAAAAAGASGQKPRQGAADSSGQRARMARPKRASGTKQRHSRPGDAAPPGGANASQLKRTNPYLSNLNPDEQLTGMLTYIIKPGEMIVGKNSTCDLLIYGPGLRGQHAKLSRLEPSVSRSGDSGDSGEGPAPSEVYIEPVFPDHDQDRDRTTPQGQAQRPRRVALMVNGEPVLERLKLNHGDRLLFGSTNYFVFIDQAAAAVRRGQNNSSSDSPSRGENNSASLDLATYEMAHQEVLRKVMSDAENEAMIREINDYTHRPGTGKGRGQRGAVEHASDTPTASSETVRPAGPAPPPSHDPKEASGPEQSSSSSSSSSFRMSRVHSSRLTRSMTIHEDPQQQPPSSSSSPPVHQRAEPERVQQSQQQQQQQQQPLGKIREEEDSELRARSARLEESHDRRQAPAEEPLDEKYRGKLMEDTYEFAMPIAEANAIAKEMGIRVTFGLKILTGEEQLLVSARELDGDEQAGSQEELLQTMGDYSTAQLGSGEFQPASNETGGGGGGGGGGYLSAEEVALERMEPDSSTLSSNTNMNSNSQEVSRWPEPFVISHGPEALKPETLDLPPELYVHVHLDELGVDFYWSKEKFHERRIKMLELYGAWDVGGKSGLVEYLIEQSKYQGYYMIDPFIDDVRSTFVLVGHAQVTLQPVSHLSNLLESFDILDVNDEIVGQVHIEATPCREREPELAAEMLTGTGDETRPPYRALNETELGRAFLERPSELLGRRLVFLLQILACSNVPPKFGSLFCQYTLNREQGVVRTRMGRTESGPLAGGETTADGPHGREPGGSANSIEFNHSHFVVIERVTQDHLDFLQHGFLTIQLVGLYDLAAATTSATGGRGQRQQSTQSQAAADDGAADSAGANPSSSAPSANQSAASSSGLSSISQPTLISTIISSINKYRFRMEQQSAMMASGGGNFSAGGASVAAAAAMNFASSAAGSVYANSLTDSAKSGNYRMAGSSGIMNSNSGASSVTSASATINLFDQQQDDEEGNSVNGSSQENIIDMILTKRKLDRAENQLHYIKRTINIAEHYNKKNIPVRTVKKLLNSYNQELDGGSLEDMAAEVATETKGTSGKSSGCVIQ